MNATHRLSAWIMAGFLLGGAATALAQDESTPDEVTPAAVVSQSLGTSVNAVDVYVLRCTTKVAGQIARAQVQDLGGIDLRRIYVHLTRTFTGQTSKRTAPDGGLSPVAAVLAPDASIHFVVVGKDRSSPTGEAYRLGTDCIAGGIVRPHTLVFLQNQ